MDKKYTRVYLIRHGETDWNKKQIIQGRENTPLNQDGITQSEELAEYFSSLEDNVDMIITSPLKRAAKTAEIIAEKLGKDTLYVEDDFIERDYGEISGMTFAEREAKYPGKEYRNSGKIEDFTTLKKRGYNAFLRNVENNRGKTLVMVSHSGIINSILHVISEGELGTGKDRLKNCCICLIEVNKDNETNLIFYNKISNEGIQDFYKKI